MTLLQVFKGQAPTKKEARQIAARRALVGLGQVTADDDTETWPRVPAAIQKDPLAELTYLFPSAKFHPAFAMTIEVECQQFSAVARSKREAKRQAAKAALAGLRGRGQSAL